MLMMRKITHSLKTALGERDAYTKDHSDRVGRLAVELGRHCKLSMAELGLLQLSAEMHDVGKIGVPDHVLLKDGHLNAEEWYIMRTHSEVGERICQQIDHEHAPILATAVRHHHESFDGTGYPDGLGGEDIPLNARIILIVDSYDALCTTRPYRPPHSHEQALRLLQDGRHKKYDPYLLDAFLKLIAISPNRVA